MNDSVIEEKKSESAFPEGEDEKEDLESHSEKAMSLEPIPEIQEKVTPKKEIQISLIKQPSLKEITNNPLPSSHKKSLIAQFAKKKVSTKRLIIKEITLENFKSYQGKQVIGPFHKRFTSIVGPNGSGKSNLIESLLFVFGKKASWMRLNKLYELIHNSSNHQGVKKASVEVRFCEIIDTDEEEYEVVPNSEFTVKRVVYHTSISKYEINDEEANQKEVVDLLKSKGIDLTNHRFLILQGEVEQISLMKPKSGKQDDPGLLEYLEDIIGSYVYKEKIESLEEEYFKLYELKREKNDLVNISKLELLKLESAKNVAIEYVKKEKQIFQLVNISHQIARHKSNKEVMKNETVLNEIQVNKKEEEKKMREKIKDKENLLKNYKKKKTDLDEMKDKIQTYENKIQECEKKDIKLRKDMEHQLELDVKFQEQIKDLEKKYHKIIENANEIKKVLPNKKINLTSLQEKRDIQEQKLNEIMLDLNKKADRFRKQKKEIESKLEPFQKALNTLNNEVNIVNNELNFLNSNASNYKEEIIEIQEKEVQIKEKIGSIKNVLLEIEKAFANMKNVKSEFQTQIELCKKEEDLLLRDISEIQTRLQESQSTASEQHQKNHILNELMKAQQKRELSGIHGRLGDLGIIDEKYDIAITSCCPSLDSIVVAKIEDAVKGVEYLRANKIGRATFISLDKMESWQNSMNKQFNAPKGTARLFDLIKIKNEMYRSVFYFALRDTLICEDIDLATQIAYGTPRHRVVVINGVVIETTGAMSGGGKPKKGGMASKIINEGMSLEQTNELNERKRLKMQELEEVRRKRGSAESELQVVMKDEIQATKERKKYETEYEFLVQQEKDNENKMKEIQKIMDNRDKVESKKRDLEIKLKDKLNEQKKIEGSMAPINEEKDKIEQKIAEIGGEDLKNQQTLTEETIKAYEVLEKEVSKLSLNLDSTQTNLEKNEAEKLKAEKHLSEVTEKFKNLKEQSEQLENETLGIMGSKKAAMEKLTMMEEDFKKDTIEKDQLENILTELRNTLSKFNDQLDEIKISLKKAKEEYNKENSELEKNRKSYKDAIANYDFLDQIDEIEQYHVAEDKDKLQISMNESMLEMSIIIPNNPNGDDDALGGPPKKKVKITMESQTLESIDVSHDLSMEQLDNIERIADRLKMKIASEQEKFKGMSPNINSIVEFRNKFMEHKLKADDLEKARAHIEEIKNHVDNLKKTRFDEFMNGFNVINCKLRETYQLLTNGGDAELELIDSFDPFSEGVVFSVRPPKKSWKQMTKLSGGEKTLSSLALVFALHYFKPTPLYFMDEIDAALDFKNVAIVAKYIKERTKDAQFIIISLRNNMFELANKLVGVYKTYDTTKTVAINPGFFNLMIEKVA